jgi:hypothetical protein
MHNATYLDMVAEELNDRPRKRLGRAAIFFMRLVLASGCSSSHYGTRGGEAGGQPVRPCSPARRSRSSSTEAGWIPPPTPETPQVTTYLFHSKSVFFCQPGVDLDSRHRTDLLLGVAVVEPRELGLGRVEREVRLNEPGTCFRGERLPIRASGPKRGGIYGSPKAGSRTRYACRSVRPSLRCSRAIPA